MKIDDFKKKFPNFSDEILANYYETALSELCLFGADRECGCSEVAQLYALAHLMTVFSKLEAGTPIIKGEITSKSVDGISVSYRQSSDNYTQQMRFWQSTPYGELYLRAMEGCGLGAVFV